MRRQSWSSTWSRSRSSRSTSSWRKSRKWRMKPSQSSWHWNRYARSCWIAAKCPPQKREKKHNLFYFPLQGMSFGYFCGLWPGQACLSLTIFIILMFCWQDISLVDPPAAGRLTAWSFLRTFTQNSTQAEVQMKFFARCKWFSFLVWKCGIQPADQATSLINLQEQCDSVCPLKSSPWALKRCEFSFISSRLFKKAKKKNFLGFIIAVQWVTDMYLAENDAEKFLWIQIILHMSGQRGIEANFTSAIKTWRSQREPFLLFKRFSFRRFQNS